MSDLREQLALRLGGAFSAAIMAGYSSTSNVDNPTHPWEAVADECLRQMEWARTRGFKQGIVSRGLHSGMVVESSSGEEEIKRVISRLSPTLAPDDWKP